MPEHISPQVLSDSQSSSPDDAQAIAIVNALWSAWKSAAIYDSNNQAFQVRQRALIDQLHRAWSHFGDVTVGFQNDYFFVCGIRLNYTGEFSGGRDIAHHFSRLHLGQLAIPVGTPEPVIDAILSTLAHTDIRADDPFAKLKESWIENIDSSCTIKRLPDNDSKTFRIRDTPSGDVPLDPETIRRRRVRSLFKRTGTVVAEFWERVRDRNSFDSQSTLRVVQQMIDQLASDEEMLLQFSALKDFDEYTYYHSVNVAIYSIAIGMRLGLNREQLADLGFAALFHDIGKVRLPQDLITKPEEFDEDDWGQIRRHPALGAMTLARLHELDERTVRAMSAAYEHHMKIDLTGYPQTSSNRILSLFSRIIAVSDSYDAMTSGRVYMKTAVSPDEAMRRLLYQQGSWYDSHILKAFVNAVGVFPVGTIVRLDDGCVGIVKKNDPEDLYAPEVLLVRSATGEKVNESIRLCSSGVEGFDAAKTRHIAEVLDEDSVDFALSDYLGMQEDDKAPEVVMEEVTS